LEATPCVLVPQASLDSRVFDWALTDLEGFVVPVVGVYSRDGAASRYTSLV
jgi:hypothetical protein